MFAIEKVRISHYNKQIYDLLRNRKYKNPYTLEGTLGGSEALQCFMCTTCRLILIKVYFLKNLDSVEPSDGMPDDRKLVVNAHHTS